MALFTGLTLSLTSFLGGTTAAAAISAFLVDTASQVLTSMLVGLILGGDKSPAFAIQGSIQTGEDVPRGIVLGMFMAERSLVWGNEWGSAGSTPNAYLTTVYALSDLPVKGLSRVRVNGAWVTLSAATDEKGQIVDEFVSSNNAPFLWVKFYDGTQTAADTFLTGTVADAEYPYESTRVGYGVAYAIVTARINQEMFSGFPDVEFEIDGVKLYDISKDSTAGGSGTQRWATPSTWGGDGDYLPVVQAYNIMRGMTYGSAWFYGFQGVTAGRLPQADWVAAIGDCRASITIPTGTEPRFRASGYLRVSTENSAALEALMAACAGRIADLGGIYKPTTGVIGAAVRALVSGDVLTEFEQKFVPIKRQDELTNAISAAYPNPDDGYEIRKSPLIVDTALEAKHGGRRAQELNLYNVPYKHQIQRLQKMASKEILRARRHTLVLGPDWWDIECDQISYTDAEHGYSAKKFRVDTVTDLTDGNVAISIIEHDGADYDLDTWAGYQSTTNAHSLISRRAFPGQTVPGFDVQAITLSDGLVGRKQAIRIFWTPSLIEGADGISFEVRLKDAALESGYLADGYAPSVVFDPATDSYAVDIDGWAGSAPLPSLIFDAAFDRFGVDATWFEPGLNRVAISGTIPRKWIADGQFDIVDGVLNNCAYSARAEIVADYATEPTPWKGVTTGTVQVSEKDFTGAGPVIDRASMKPDAATDTNFIGQILPATVAIGTETQVLLLSPVATGLFKIFWHSFKFEARKTGATDWTALYQERVMYAGVWGAWVTLQSWTISSGAYGFASYSANKSGGADDYQYRFATTAANTQTDAFKAAWLVITERI
jgi:hypothetical protein